MAGIIKDFILTLVAEIIELLANFLIDIFEQTLYPERFLGQILSASVMNQLTYFIYGFGASLLVLKVLRKGYLVYIVWREGDPDSSPQDMLMGSMMAIAISATFPTLYGWMAEITLWFGSRVLYHLSNNATKDWEATLKASVISFGSLSLVNGILLLILCIYIILLIMQLLKRGIDLLILRLGVPIATAGLVDSDGGVWKPYIKIFFQAMFTTVIQLFLIELALAILMAQTATLWGLVWALVAMQAALKTPQLMQQLLVSTGAGGGVGQKVYTTMHVVNAVKSFIK